MACQIFSVGNVTGFKRRRPDTPVIKLEGSGHWPLIEQASDVAPLFKRAPDVIETAPPH